MHGHTGDRASGRAADPKTMSRIADAEDLVYRSLSSFLDKPPAEGCAANWGERTKLSRRSSALSTMNQHSSVIWTNVRLAEPELGLLQAESMGHRIIVADAGPHVLAENSGHPQLASATIVFGQPSAEDLLKSKNLRWLHVSSAGYTRYDRKDVFDHFLANKTAFTNSSSVFSEPCAEHALSVLLAHGRQLYPSYLDQLKNREWPQNEIRAASSLLSEQVILIVGFGSIGRRLAEFLRPFGCNILGFRRRPQPSEGVTVLGLEELGSKLPIDRKSVV